MNFQIIFEHEDFLIIHKPHECLVHGGNESLLKVVSESLGLNTILDPVHRLDKSTSGVILLSKNKTATSHLSGLFSERKVEKRYFAISNKKPKKKQGKVIGDMSKARNGCFKLSHSRVAPAVTSFKSVSNAPNSRLFLLHPITGKTHQLRVALKSLSSPILGDRKYGGDVSDRMYLHAYSIKFTYMNNDIYAASQFFEGLSWPEISFIDAQLDS